MPVSVKPVSRAGVEREPQTPARGVEAKAVTLSVLDLLLGEHAILHVQLRFLRQSLGRWESLRKLRSHVDLLALEVSSHAKLENDLLLTALGQELEELLPLHTEHEQVKEAVERLLKQEDLSQAQTQLAHLIDSVQGHFRREEKNLIPLARRILSEEELNNLGLQWAIRRGIRL